MTELSVGPHTLAVVPSTKGPVVVDDGTGLEPLAVLLNVAAADRAFGDAVDGRSEASDARLWIRPDGNEALIWSLGASEEVRLAWPTLQAALRDLRNAQEDWVPPPGPWLFRPDPIGPLPSPDDWQIMQHMKEEGGAVDRLDLSAEVGHEPTDLIERRRSFLHWCDERGLFALHPFMDARGDARSSALRNARATNAAELRDAALSLRTWNLLQQGRSPLDDGVCLDYVRHQLWPPRDDGATWVDRTEHLLVDVGPGDQGVVVEHAGDSSVRVFWRRDGTRPGLLAVALGRG